MYIEVFHFNILIGMVLEYLGFFSFDQAPGKTLIGRLSRHFPMRRSARQASPPEHCAATRRYRDRNRRGGPTTGAWRKNSVVSRERNTRGVRSPLAWHIHSVNYEFEQFSILWIKETMRNISITSDQEECDRGIDSPSGSFPIPSEWLLTI